MTCVRCGAAGNEDARGWRAYRSDFTAEAQAEDTTAGDVPAVVCYCPAGAAREFGAYS